MKFYQDKSLEVRSSLVFVVLVISGVYLGWISADDWLAKGMSAFVGAFVGFCVWLVTMLAYGIWNDYKERR